MNRGERGRSGGGQAQSHSTEVYLYLTVSTIYVFLSNTKLGNKHAILRKGGGQCRWICEVQSKVGHLFASEASLRTSPVRMYVYMSVTKFCDHNSS